ncbi:Haloacid Dehalogenase superfamily, subfamily IB, phosphoserine phosphatase-like [Neorhodopirellula lusitana]|uniref:phosphoserine phosphatase n=1 Tax=Neorhodopirellula lusitana TaxID=445327 RepID=A0ABY1Q4M1_9BACT|nr:HAD-IB family phosphatase [Neorhodopirellula lusitana]SMP59540.1 Haloacid Dehalogenase superfamily, subfamily IB, phosphoserine phosphatase-like [Neorhodopirellula lusitana]
MVNQVYETYSVELNALSVDGVAFLSDRTQSTMEVNMKTKFPKSDQVISHIKDNTLESTPPTRVKHLLLASDFDQTLSFNDSGEVLSEMLGLPDFERKVQGLANSHLVQQGGELTYLLLHDPDYRQVRREHLIETGRRIRLKKNLAPLMGLLQRGIDGHRFTFYVVSASPEDVVRSALEGIVPPERIIGTKLNFDHDSGEISSVSQLTAGYGKVTALDKLQTQLGISWDRIVYVGDGSSDVHVMLHVNRCDGYTIAVSENQHLAPIARRTVLSDNAFSVLIPILEDVIGWTDRAQIRELFESHDLDVRGWDKTQVDRLTILPTLSEANGLPMEVATMA